MLCECGLDFFEFDPESANFHLAIRTADIIDVSVGQIARQISGFIQSLPGVAAKGVWNKSFRGQFGLIQISSCQVRAPYM